MPITVQAMEPLQSPYPAPTQHAFMPSLPQEGLTCPQVRTPPQNLDFTSIYTNRDHGISIVDEEAKEAYKEQTRALRKFGQRVSDWSMMVLAYPQADADYLSCIDTWMTSWAEKDAMLGQANSQGEAVRKWFLASIASSYVQIRDRVDPESKEVIEGWMNRLAYQVLSDYSRKPKSMSRQNNHINWAAWAVMIAGVALDNRELYDWSVREYKKAVSRINHDGTLPLELARQSKAFNYHIFAAAPLVMMAETAAANGTDLYGYKGGRLHTLVNMIVKELDNGQRYITEKTGVAQNLSGTVTGSQLAWMEVYYTRFGDVRMLPWMEKLRPMRQRRMGGNLSFLFAQQKKEDGKSVLLPDHQ